MGVEPRGDGALNRTIAQFERLVKGIDVDYTPISGDYDAFMLARFRTKRTPDVFYVDSLDVFDYQPGLEPLNKYIANTRGFSTNPFYSRLLRGFTVNGQIWLPGDLVTARPGRERADAPACWCRRPTHARDVGPAHADDAAASVDKCSAGRGARLPRSGLGSHPRVHVPEQRRVGERRRGHGP